MYKDQRLDGLNDDFAGPKKDVSADRLVARDGEKLPIIAAQAEHVLGVAAWQWLTAPQHLWGRADHALRLHAATCVRGVFHRQGTLRRRADRGDNDFWTSNGLLRQGDKAGQGQAV